MSTDWTSRPGAGEGLNPEVVDHAEVYTTIESVADDTMVVNIGPQRPSGRENVAQQVFYWVHICSRRTSWLA